MPTAAIVIRCCGQEGVTQNPHIVKGWHQRVHHRSHPLTQRYILPCTVVVKLAKVKSSDGERVLLTLSRASSSNML